jgi:hypothetical protein
LYCVRETVDEVIVASSCVRYPPVLKAVAVEMPMRGTWTAMPVEPGRAEKTVEIPERTGSLFFRVERTPALRTAGAAEMELAMLED